MIDKNVDSQLAQLFLQIYMETYLKPLKLLLTLCCWWMDVTLDHSRPLSLNSKVVSMGADVSWIVAMSSRALRQRRQLLEMTNNTTSLKCFCHCL